MPAEKKPEYQGARFGRTWIVTAAWAHPAWDQYAIAVYDLTSPGPVAPILYRQDVTHEFVIYALEPKKGDDRPEDGMYNRLDDEKIRGKVKLLQPANHAYQFPAPSDLHAEKWIQSLVDLIKAGKLSPDTDWTRVWNEIFAHGVSLKRS